MVVAKKKVVTKPKVIVRVMKPIHPVVEFQIGTCTIQMSKPELQKFMETMYRACDDLRIDW